MTPVNIKNKPYNSIPLFNEKQEYYKELKDSWKIEVLQSNDKEVTVIWNPKKWIKIKQENEEENLKRKSVFTAKTIWIKKKDIHAENHV